MADSSKWQYYIISQENARVTPSLFRNHWKLYNSFWQLLERKNVTSGFSLEVGLPCLPLGVGVPSLQAQPLCQLSVGWQRVLIPNKERNTQPKCDIGMLGQCSVRVNFCLETRLSPQHPWHDHFQVTLEVMWGYRWIVRWNSLHLVSQPHSCQMLGGTWQPTKKWC